MNKILLIIPNYLGFDQVIKKGFMLYGNCDVLSYDLEGPFKYKSVWQRLQNAASKAVLRKNLKPLFKQDRFLRALDEIGEVDYLIVNRADLLNQKSLDKAISLAKRSILLLWDSLEKVPLPFHYIDKFDTVYSFDLHDCEKYSFERTFNFHFFAQDPRVKIEHEALFLGTADSRLDDLITIINNLDSRGINAKAYLYDPLSKVRNRHPKIDILKDIIPFYDSDVFSKKTKVIIDLAHKNQVGLSFRIFEGIALRKKIITTNTHVRNHDFYTPANIFVIDNVENFSIPNSFWEDSYEELETSIVERYHISSWVKHILSGR